MVNWALGLIGIDPIAWNTDHPALTIVFTLTWQYTLFMMLILLAGCSPRPGGTRGGRRGRREHLQTFRYMTLPHLRTYAELAILLGTVFMIQVFDPVNIMTKGAGNTKTIAYLLYERAFIGQQIGEAAAYGVITVIVTIVVATRRSAPCSRSSPRRGADVHGSRDPSPDQPARTERSTSPFTRRWSGTHHLLTWVLVFCSSSPAVDDHHQLQDRGQAPSPPRVPLHPDPGPLCRRVRRGMGLYLLNSLFVSVLSTVVVMLLAIPAAYALSVRPIGRWQDGLFFFISTKFLPVASIIPVFLLLRSVNCSTTCGRSACSTWASTCPWRVDDEVVLRRGTPRGGGSSPDRRGQLRPRTLAVALPIVAPGAAAAALICFIFAWNEYFLANLLTVVGPDHPAFLGSFVDGRGQFLAILSAASTIAVLPVIAGWLAQKRLVRGLAMGAVK